MCQNVFHGYCYCCSNFGQEDANYAFNFRNMQSKSNQLLQHRTRQLASKQELHTTQRITHDRYNKSFDLLYNEPKCYVCHNFGHKASNCHLKDYKTDPRVNYFVESAKVWKKKENNKCGLVIYVQRQKGS